MSRSVRFLSSTGAALLVSAVLVGTASPPAGAAVTFTAVDRAAAMGLSSVAKSWSADVVDYDGDGDEDVWIGYHQWTGKLWSNDGGTYTQVATDAWPRVNPASRKVTDRHDCAFADVDQDGRPDAYCSAGRNESNLVKNGMENELWLQLSPGRFTNVGVSWGVGDVCGRGRHVTFLNVNGDAYPDLFLGDAVPRNVSDPCDSPSSGLPDENDKVFINQQGTGLVQLEDSGLTTLGLGQRCVERLDFDRDGWDDLVGCRFHNQTPKLYHNVHGRFADVSSQNGLTSTVSDVVVVDLDQDGWDDLVVAADNGFSYRLNRGGSFGPPVTLGSASSGRSVAAGDADGDGDIDVYGLIADLNGRSNPNDVVFLNDGMHFSTLSVPPASGNGDEVQAIHPYGGARTDFLVLNGGDVEGPVQVIELVAAGTTNMPPRAVLTSAACTLLSCHFDAAASTDPDGTVTGVSWTFGDGTSAEGAVVDHDYSSAGTYQVRVTVTDDGGASSSATTVVHPSSSTVTPTVTFRGSSTAQGSGKSITVTLPSASVAGDVALLFVTSNAIEPVPSVPAPWQRVGRVTDTSMSTTLWWRNLTANGSSSVTASATVGGLLNAQVLVYSGVSATTPLTASAAEPNVRTGHTAPSVTAQAGDWVVWHWADKTGQKGATTTWQLPAGIAGRQVVIPSITPRRVTTISADTGAPVGGGLVQGPVATASIASNLATMWSVVLHPSG